MLVTCKNEVGVKRYFFPLLFCGLVWENANEMNVHSKKFVYVQKFILMCMETEDNGGMTLQCFKI